jgi:competence protein ComEA
MNSSNRAAWRGYFAISLFWIAVLAGALLFTRRPAAEPIEIIPPPTPAPTATAEPSPTPLPTATPRPLRVDVIGAVRNPGVQTLPPGSIVDDAIRGAGGASDDADLERVNKAIELQDGAQVYVPRKSDLTPRPPLSAPSAAEAPPAVAQRSAPAVPQATPGGAGALVNVNTATQEELESLPGVGPKTAQAIIAGRPYASVDDLLRVKGIGPATLAKIRPAATAQ